MSHSGELYNIVLLQNKRLQFIEEKIIKMEEQYNEQQRLINLLRNLIDKKSPQSHDEVLFEIDYLKDVFTDKDVDISNFYQYKLSSEEESDVPLIPSYLYDT